MYFINKNTYYVKSLSSREKITLKADHILVSTGRKPHTDKLNLQKAGVKMDNRGRI